MIRVPGLARFRADLERVSADVSDTTDPDRIAAGLVASAIAARAPRRTGRLAASVRTGDRHPAGTEVVVDAIYGGVIEGGWAARNITPHPYVAPAVNDTEPEFESVYDQHTQEAFDNMDYYY